MPNEHDFQSFAYHQHFPQSARSDPQPPYAVEITNYLLLGVAFDRKTLRALVPDCLNLPPRVEGFIGTGLAPSGYGITPFSNFYLALGVDGILSSDGTPALFRPLNIYSERAGRIFRKHYNALIKLGTHSFTQTGDIWRAQVTAEDGLAVDLAVRKNPGATSTTISGTHLYLGQDALDQVTSHDTSYSGDATPAHVIDFAISGGDPRFHLQPDFTWAAQIDRLSITIGAPRGSPFAAADPNPKAAALTALLGQIGLAAVCLTRDGRLLSANSVAKSMLADIASNGRVLARRASGQLAIDPAFLAKLGHRGQSVTVLLERSKGGLPTIVQAFTIGRDLIEEDALLVLFRDPAGRDPVAPNAVLQLLGLTPAEARLAATVGAGHSLSASAQRLGITANTARSTLQVVYGKLQIGRQSELAGIITRIATGAGCSP